MSRNDPPRLPEHRDCETLTGLPLDYLPADGSLGRVRRVKKGRTLWQPDDPAGSIFFLRDGRVALTRTDIEGKELLVHTVEPGQPFGFFCLCSKTRQNWARASEASEVVEIALSEFLSYVQTSRDALTALVVTICLRLSDAEQHAEVLARRGVEKRIGRLLLRLAISRPRSPGRDRGGSIALERNHEELAQMAAMSRPYVTVALGKLRRRGLIHYERRGPIVVKVPALTAYLTDASRRDDRVG